jgi:type IV fimbrial biogenesis protein FimT
MLGSPHPHEGGVSLVELIIAIAITAVLLAAGMPSFTSWLQNAQVRTAAELLQNGLQTARSEAVTRNAQVRFSVADPTGNGFVAWSIGCVVPTATCPAEIKRQDVGEGGTNARIGIMTGPVTTFTPALAAGVNLPGGVTFNGAGRIPAANITAGTEMTRADITNASLPSAKRLVVTVSTGGQIRMCDPQRPSTDPRGCSL